MIIQSPVRQKKLQKYLATVRGIVWDEYLQRFEGSKPIELWLTNYTLFRLQPEDTEFKIDLIGIINSKYSLKKFEKQNNLVVGFKKKVTKEEIENLPYLHANVLGLKHLIRKDIIELMLQLCPDDFEAIPVKVISANKHVEPFELNDYYTINVLRCIKAIDEANSDIVIDKDGWANIKKFRYRENPWEECCIPWSERGKAAEKMSDNLSEEERAELDKCDATPQYEYYTPAKPCKIAIDALSGAIVWHPSVAKLFPYDPLFWFVQDVEQGLWYK